MSKPIDQEREAFEAAVTKDGWPHADRIDRASSGDYCVPRVQNKWLGWQLARAALQPAGVAVPDESSSLTDRLARFLGVVRGCERLASDYSGSLDGVDEHGGDDHEDPICAVFHRLYYAMFDGDKLLKDLREALAAAPHPVSGDFNPEHTLFNDIRGSMPVNEDDEPTRYIINEAQLQRIRALEFGQHPVSGDLIRFDFINADGNPDSKMITHDEMRERFTSLQRSVSGEQTVAQVIGRVHHNPEHAEPVRAVLNSIGRQLPDYARLYAAPPAAQDVAGLVELLQQVRLGEGEEARHGAGFSYWNNAVLACQIAIRDAVTAHRAQQGEQP